MWSTETAEEIRSLMAKGWAGTVFLSADDVEADASCRFDDSLRRSAEVLRSPREGPASSRKGWGWARSSCSPV
jgi:hypothetical protein